MSDHLKGILITTLGVLALSPDTLLIRLAATEQWTLLFWRSLFFSIGVVLFVLVSHRKSALGEFSRIGLPGLFIGIIFGIGNITFVLAVQHTSIANTLIIISISPVIAALLSWYFLSEKTPARTWAAIFIILIATTAIIVNGVNSSGFWGDLSALATALLMAITFTVTRHFKHINMVPALAISGVLVSLSSFFIANTLSLQNDVIAYVVIMGLMLAFSFSLITIGPRYIPAAEVSMLLLLESIFGSYLGWLVLGEKPSTVTFVGGFIIISTLCIHAWVTLRVKETQV